MLRLGESALDSISSILLLGAHSDDIEIGCGGTILTMLERNPDVSVHWVVLSANDERHEEALKSANTFLASAARADIVVKDFEERYFPYTGAEIKRFFDALGATSSPDLILTHYGEDRHQDHRLISELTWNTFRDNMILEYEVPKWDGDLGRPNVFVPLSPAHCDAKVDTLLREFATQQRHDWFTPETFWALLRLRGVESRSPSGYAEAFYARKLVL